MAQSMYCNDPGQKPTLSEALAKTLAWLKTQKMAAAKVTLDYLLEREHQQQLGNCVYGYQDEGLLARFGIGVIREEPIHLGDNRMLAEYIQEYQRLMKLASAHTELGRYTEADKVTRECEEIQKYLREISYQGKLTQVTDCQLKHRQSVRLKLKYLQNKARKQDPEIARFLHELLR